MSEIINTYLMNDKETLLPMERSAFYEEQIRVVNETGHPTRACDIIDVCIFNTDGEILIQKRSKNKNHNPGMFDKTIGGHVAYGDTYSHTVMVETVQELQTPSIVLNSDTDFQKTLNLLREYTETIAIVKHHNTNIHKLSKIIKGKSIPILNRVHLYFGIYNGRIYPVDKEAQGVLYYNLDDLIDEMKTQPQLFTHDMHYFIEYFEQDMRDFITKVQEVMRQS